MNVAARKKLRRKWHLPTLLATVTLAASGCSGSAVDQTPSAATSAKVPTQDATSLPNPTSSTSSSYEYADPRISRIGNKQWKRIVRAGVWRNGCPVGRKQLRRLDINYIDFADNIQRGSLVAHRDAIEDLAGIFSELLAAAFPIASMRPAENFNGDLRRILEANNTSAFNCRRPNHINAPVLKSPHANGRAIDINPVQNPWKDPRCKCWVPSKEFRKANEGPGVIRQGSLPWQLFTVRGWIWQNIKVPDYMHFDTGYPSKPRTVSDPTKGANS